jgi:hypothetical protein
LYVIGQEGTPVVIDRRKNMGIVRKMPGAKGSVRDAKILLAQGGEGQANEFLFTVGCDRHMRIFDVEEEFRHNTVLSEVYMKQKLNTLCFV